MGDYHYQISTVANAATTTKYNDPLLDMQQKVRRTEPGDERTDVASRDLIPRLTPMLISPLLASFLSASGCTPL